MGMLDWDFEHFIDGEVLVGGLPLGIQCDNILLLSFHEILQLLDVSP